VNRNYPLDFRSQLKTPFNKGLDKTSSWNSYTSYWLLCGCIGRGFLNGDHSSIWLIILCRFRMRY
jgi:hypothetical protein